MRRYEEGQERELVQVVCNKCGRTLKVENGVLKEGCFHGIANLGYFSHRDGVKQHFDLCESCYDEMTAQFELPPEEEDATEFL